MRGLIFGFALTALAGPTMAATEAEAKQLYDALRMHQIVDIMQVEGMDYGTRIGTDMFPDGGDANWLARVAKIYDPLNMHRTAEAAFVSAVADADVAPMIAFFESDPGASFVALEVSARRAMLDEAVDEMSREAAASAMQDKTPRFTLVEEFATVNDLIESNVVGALNSNFAFYQGLAAGGAFDAVLTEDQILTDVWDQEPEVRVSTTEWVYSFLMLAYDPMDPGELEAYIDFSKGDAWRVLNAALFDTFDDMFEDISYALGLAAANRMAVQDL